MTRDELLASLQGMGFDVRDQDIPNFCHAGVMPPANDPYDQSHLEAIAKALVRKGGIKRRPRRKASA